MDPLPSSIILDIFSRIPARCLARLRCVSKLWCEYIDDPHLGIIHGQRLVEEEPTLIMFHQNPAIPRLPRTLCFHTIQSATTMKLSKAPYMEFACKKPLSTCSDYVTRVHFRGSCNGLLYISQDDCEALINMSVIHPLRKECYELPSLSSPVDCSQFDLICGLGFDAWSNTYKAVCVLEHRRTMVHAFGTDSWHEIPQVPPYRVEGQAIFVQGCLYWVVKYLSKNKGCLREVVWFDVRKEEFGLIKPPNKTTDEPTHRKQSNYYDHLVDLNGEVGYVCNRTLEVWVLKQQEWVLYCRMDEDRLPNMRVTLLGCRNKVGDIVITAPSEGSDRYYVYVLESGVIHKVDILGRKKNLGTGIVMFPNSLFSTHGINTNCNSIRKRLFGLKKSCPRAN